MSSDVLLIVPFEPATASTMDAKFRQTSGAFLNLPVARAIHELERFVGRQLDFWEPDNRPIFGDRPMQFPVHRSLTAVALATHLERAGLRWAAIDPGVQDLSYWRRTFEKLKGSPPLTIAVSTTFIMSAPWLKTLCAIARETLPESKLLIGGYYYATNTRQFFSLNADVFCVGEGEIRLPQIVAAIRDNKPLDNIRGLYIRRSDGTLQHTGHTEPLNFSGLPPVDYSLASRIEPPVDLARDQIEYGVETQRGCVFQCEFCTYRTLASPSVMEPEEAVEAIMRTNIAPGGYINMADSTATFPHKRWEEMMRLLVERGGSPHPIWAFARVSDISERTAEMMARAGVRQVFVGQESGDQRMLDAMKKGTKSKQVRPAIEALGRHGIGATFGFFHGFPGETTESIQATRALITSLNDDFKDRPVVLTYLLYPFIYMDFAAASRRESLQGVDHYLGYESAEMPPKRTVEEVLATVIAASRVPHAPPFAFLFEAAPATSGIGLFSSPHRHEIFRWLKAVERGVTIFLERDLDGTPVNLDELRRQREVILSRYNKLPAWRSALAKMASRTRAGMMRRLGTEWAEEQTAGVGLLTRTILAASAFQDTRKLAFGLRTWSEGAYATGADAEAEVSVSDQTEAVDEFASDLIERALTKPNKLKLHKLSSTASGQQISDAGQTLPLG